MFAQCCQGEALVREGMGCERCKKLQTRLSNNDGEVTMMVVPTASDAVQVPHQNTHQNCTEIDVHCRWLKTCWLLWLSWRKAHEISRQLHRWGCRFVPRPAL